MVPSRKPCRLKVTPKKGRTPGETGGKKVTCPVGDEVFWGSTLQSFILFFKVCSGGPWVISLWLSYHSS